MEDETLLFLIYQHLKVRGYDKAAKVLENHVSQVSSSVPVWIHMFSSWFRTGSGGVLFGVIKIARAADRFNETKINRYAHAYIGF